MKKKNSAPSPLAELISAISIPESSRIPDGHGRSTPAEYDLYFRILRENSGLVDWSRTCVSTLDAQLDDLENSSLSEEEKNLILQGMIQVISTTLQKWIRLSEAFGANGGHPE